MKFPIDEILEPDERVDSQCLVTATFSTEETESTKGVVLRHFRSFHSAREGTQSILRDEIA